jgi:hypothetical protein
VSPAEASVMAWRRDPAPESLVLVTLWAWSAAGRARASKTERREVGDGKFMATEEFAFLLQDPLCPRLVV